LSLESDIKTEYSSAKTLKEFDDDLVRLRFIDPVRLGAMYVNSADNVN